MCYSKKEKKCVTKIIKRYVFDKSFPCSSICVTFARASAKIVMSDPPSSH